MIKNQVKYIVDVLMGIFFLIVFFTGLIKWPSKAIGSMIPSSNVSIIHDYSGIFLGITVVIHLILNWSWIINMTKKYFFKKILAIK
jgi:hypothetical protein